MRTRVCLTIVLFAALPAWPQAGGDSQMHTPPPVSGESYSGAVASEARTNYLHTGFVVSTSYSDNVSAGTSAAQVGDTSYSIWPTIALDQTTTRLHQTFTYSPGFTFYQHTSSLNEADQNLNMDFQYRLSPHVTASVRDSLRKTSNVLNQPYLLSEGAVSGATQGPLVPIVAPVADQISNAANVELTYQFTQDAMIGGSGNFTNLHYPNPNQVLGLADSNSRGGSAFYNYRLSRVTYFGFTYQYSLASGSLPTVQNQSQEGSDSETRTHSVLLFLTFYLKPGLSLSITGGPQHYSVSEPDAPTISAWGPAATASMSWQGSRASFAASYSHTVGGGGGLVGAFDSNSASASARWRLERTWTVGTTANYSITKNVSPFAAQSNPGGHTVLGNVTLQHPITNRLSFELGYTRLHQSYSNIASVSVAPDANRGFVSMSYQLTRPLGR